MKSIWYAEFIRRGFAELAAFLKDELNTRQYLLEHCKKTGKMAECEAKTDAISSWLACIYGEEKAVR